MNDPLRPPVCEMRIVFADGTQESRVWYYGEAIPDDLDPQDWMVEPRKSWPHPRSPIILSCLVAEGKEDEARDWLKAQEGGRLVPWPED